MLFHNLESFSHPTTPRSASYTPPQETFGHPSEEIISPLIDTTIKIKPDVDFQQMLSKEVHGITYRMILEHFAHKSQGLYIRDCLNSLALTEQLLSLNPEKTASLQEIRSSERFVDKLLSFVPIFGSPLKSTEYLIKHGELNEAVKELHEVGLLTTDTQVYTPLLQRTGMGFTHGIPSFTSYIHITRFGLNLIEG